MKLFVSRRSASALVGIGIVLAGAAVHLLDDVEDFPAGSMMAQIRQRGVLIVGTKFDQPAFGYKSSDTGRIGGFDAELARMIAQDLTGDGRNVRFVESMSRDREGFLVSGIVDLVIATYSITAERQKIIDFAGPYYYAAQDIMIRSRDRRIGSVRDLGGRKVCTVAGSTSLSRLQVMAPTARLVPVTTYSQCVPPLLDGRFDAISTDNTILLGLIGRAPGLARLVNRPFAREPYGIGIRLQNPVFRGYLNGFLAKILRDGSWDRAYQQTIGAMGLPLSAQAGQRPRPEDLQTG